MLEKIPGNAREDSGNVPKDSGKSKIPGNVIKDSGECYDSGDCSGKIPGNVIKDSGECIRMYN